MPDHPLPHRCAALAGPWTDAAVCELHLVDGDLSAAGHGMLAELELAVSLAASLMVSLTVS
jgi:hypothetical protein